MFASIASPSKGAGMTRKDGHKGANWRRKFRLHKLVFMRQTSVERVRCRGRSRGWSLGGQKPRLRQGSGRYISAHKHIPKTNYTIDSAGASPNPLLPVPPLGEQGRGVKEKYPGWHEPLNGHEPQNQNRKRKQQRKSHEPKGQPLTCPIHLPRPENQKRKPTSLSRQTKPPPCHRKHPGHKAPCPSKQPLSQQTKSPSLLVSTSHQPRG